MGVNQRLLKKILRIKVRLAYEFSGRIDPYVSSPMLQISNIPEIIFKIAAALTIPYLKLHMCS
jgi:hypothetical protein